MDSVSPERRKVLDASLGGILQQEPTGRNLQGRRVTRMASRKRGGQRHDTSNGGEEQQVWDGLRGQLNQLAANEAKAKEINKQIFELEASMKALEKVGKSKTIALVHLCYANGMQNPPLKRLIP